MELRAKRGVTAIAANIRICMKNLPIIALIVMIAHGPAFAAPDEGKRACYGDAKRLCAVEMRSMRRSKVSACLVARIDATSPVCHAAMLKLKSEHDQTALRQVR
jgi:hypothetical protein